jgi:hydroxyethylthiazole kinase-like sugar kinase family protein
MRWMIAMVIQKGIMETRNTSVNVPAVMKNNQMKNPITCDTVTSSIMSYINN